MAADLPAGYAAVEWIESTKGGKQFIDTGYTANGQTRVELDAVVPVRWEQEDRFGVLFGSRTMNDWTAKAFALGNDGSSVCCGYGSGDKYCCGIAGSIPSGRVTVARQKVGLYDTVSGRFFCRARSREDSPRG